MYLKSLSNLSEIFPKMSDNQYNRILKAIEQAEIEIRDVERQECLAVAKKELALANGMHVTTIEHRIKKLAAVSMANKIVKLLEARWGIGS